MYFRLSDGIPGEMSALLGPLSEENMWSGKYEPGKNNQLDKQKRRSGNIRLNARIYYGFIC